MMDNVRYFDVTEYGESLLARPQGQKVLKKAKDELQKLRAEGILILDFQNVHYVTAICLIEILEVFDVIKHREFQGKYVVLRLESVNRDLEDCLVLALRERALVVPWLDEKGNWAILGELTMAQRETLETIRQRTQVTSIEIAKLLGIPINAASNRLKNLYDQKLVMRKKNILHSTGGIQFSYRWLFS